MLNLSFYVDLTKKSILTSRDLGIKKIEETRKMEDSQFLVDHGNTEVSNGNFSGAVKQGFLMDRGKISYPLIGTIVSGNSYKLMKNVSGISKSSKLLSLGGYPLFKVL